MSLDLTKPVRTRDGQAVEIKFTDGREPYPIIGYIGDDNILSSWTIDGKFDADDELASDLDLVNA